MTNTLTVDLAFSRHLDPKFKFSNEFPPSSLAIVCYFNSLYTFLVSSKLIYIITYPIFLVTLE